MANYFISATDMVHIIKDAPSVQMILDRAGKNYKESVLIDFEDSRLTHIWLNKGNERISYEKKDGEWDLCHYHWYEKKGWTFVGKLISVKVKSHHVRF